VRNVREQVNLSFRDIASEFLTSRIGVRPAIFALTSLPPHSRLGPSGLERPARGGMHLRRPRAAK